MSRPSLSYANVMSTIAVFLALGRRRVGVQRPARGVNRRGGDDRRVREEGRQAQRPAADRRTVAGVPAR